MPKPAGAAETDAFGAKHSGYVDTLEARFSALGALADDIRTACTLVEHRLSLILGVTLRTR